MTKKNSSNNQEVATLAGGCFWCMEAIFKDLKGVKQVEPGYSGGDLPHPTYEQVCTGETGHAEVVQIIFDPQVISYKELLEVFFTVHNPTTLNRQGEDIGTQYRSAIFYHTPEQKNIAGEVITEFEEKGIWEDLIVTEITAFEAFYPAEDYHRNYFENNPDKAYCRMVIAPKVAKFRRKFLEKLKR